ncbi:MAG: nitroreductase family deazaflavin-dependent oxidoreductase [Acidimicrobiia bacterium]|nr:nitroreductase family deazaflavin-dependent oxidoreductase [Acidimicrobiia bacterium]
MRDGTAKKLSAIHTAMYRATRGRIGRRLVNNDMLLLSTVGRKSGKAHTVPLLYVRDERDLVVIASWGGRDRHPDWYLNLLATPKAEAQVVRDRFPVRARTANPEERQRLWPAVVAAYDGYTTYQSRTDREIPVVLLSPSG